MRRFEPLDGYVSGTKLGALRRLRRDELPLGTIALARYLIGKILVREAPAGRRAGRIVETEAYIRGDRAAHTFGGLTKRNRSLFLEHGHAYVYYIYGFHHLLNVSGNAEGVGEGVLLRAMEPLLGVKLMQRARGTTRLVDLARGPGRLAAAMQVDLSFDGIDLCQAGPLWLAEARKARRRAVRIGESARIGIRRDADRVLRFYERGSWFVSGPKRLRA